MHECRDYFGFTPPSQLLCNRQAIPEVSDELMKSYYRRMRLTRTPDPIRPTYCSKELGYDIRRDLSGVVSVGSHRIHFRFPYKCTALPWDRAIKFAKWSTL